jgi:organic hydroperoxide reductase OsmC/OhrA
MYDTSGVEPDGEWFELHNTASSARSLAGLTLVDGGNRTHTIKAGTTIAAGAYVVFVRNRSVSTTAKVPGASAEAFGAAAEKAKAGCPISRLLGAAAKITMDAKLA